MQRLRRWVAVPGTAWAVLAVGACLHDEVAPGPAPAAVARRGLSAGRLDPDHPAVVALRVDDHAICTGTLVDPSWVLAAAHCLADGPVQVAPAPGAEGSPAAQTLVHPEYDWFSRANDVALVALPSAWAIPPMGLPEPSTPEPLPGDLARLVGFGHSGAAGQGEHEKRQGFAEIAAVEPTRITLTPAPSAPCAGDSGGPVLAEGAEGEIVIGVIGQGDESCSSSSRALRVDAVMADFIAPTLGRGWATEPEPPAATTGCLGGRGAPLWALWGLYVAGLKRRRGARRPPASPR